MKLSLLFLFLGAFSISASAQGSRENRPLLNISEDPDRILEENIQGWSISLDGQWYSAENTIPLRSKSYDRDNDNEHLAELGLDNFERWEFRTVEYRGKNYELWMKFTNTGGFKYPETFRRWSDAVVCTYYLFNADDIPDHPGDNGETQLHVIPLLSSGTLTTKDENEIRQIVASEAQPVEDHPFELIIQTQKTEDGSEVRWQIFARHRLFDDTRGILNPIKSNSISVLGTDRLFVIAYYACSPGVFEQAFMP